MLICDSCKHCNTCKSAKMFKELEGIINLTECEEYERKLSPKEELNKIINLFDYRKGEIK